MSSTKIKKTHFFHSSKYTNKWGYGFGKLGVLTNPKLRALETKNSEIEKIINLLKRDNFSRSALAHIIELFDDLKIL